MDCKFTITCKSCGCRTELSHGKWETSTVFTCPNCKAQMPETLFKPLLDIASSVAMIPDDSNFSIAINSPWGQESC